MAGEDLAFRRAAVGAPIADFARLIDRARVNTGGHSSSSSSSADTSTSTAVITCTASATPHTKGSYVQLIASTTHDTETLTITFHGGVFTDTFNTSTLLDIAVGGAGSEVDLISNLAVGDLAPRITYVIPIKIASGSRVSARIQSVIVSKQITISAGFRAHGDNQAVPTTCTTYGVTSGNSNGVTLTAPGSTNTKAAWTQITSATTADLTRLFVAIHSGQSGQSASTGLIDIGTGASSSEVVVIPDLFYEMLNTELIWPATSCFAFTIAIPSGTRLAARYQSTSTAAGGAPKIALYGLA